MLQPVGGIAALFPRANVGAMDQTRADRPIFQLRGRPPRQHLRIAASATTADFSSQVIAGRQPAPDAPSASQAAIKAAVIAYDKSARITVRRMPAGYRKTVIT